MCKSHLAVDSGRLRGKDLLVWNKRAGAAAHGPLVYLQRYDSRTPFGQKRRELAACALIIRDSIPCDLDPTREHRTALVCANRRRALVVLVRDVSRFEAMRALLLVCFKSLSPLKKYICDISELLLRRASLCFSQANGPIINTD